jgi:FkbM family methyltransferase
VRRIISGESIRFPARWSRYYPADYDAPKFAFLRAHCQPGDVVLDLGAHIGLFTVFMANQVAPSGRVYSFEPTAFTRRVLEETIGLNGCESVVEVRPEAVSRGQGEATLHDTGDPLSNANSLISLARGKREQRVQTIGVDGFVEERALTVRCMKIDVEGAELDVLEGAARTINRCRPAIEVELHPAALRSAGHALSDVWALCDRYNLAVFCEARPVDEAWLLGRAEAVDVQLMPRERVYAQAGHI